MADGSHFVKNLKKIKVAYRSEMDRNEIESDFRTSKMATGVLIWNGKKCDTKWFLDIQNGYRRPFLKKTFTQEASRPDSSAV